MRNTHMKHAFTMLELVFVIGILGIVASIGSEIIVRVYEQYIIQRAQYKSSFKTELAAYEIANRLTNAIPGTVYRIKSDDTLEPITTLPTPGSTYKGLQWVGTASESFDFTKSATPRYPGWSGFCDLNASTINSIKTPGSNLVAAATVIGNLGGTVAGSRLFFAKETSTSVDNNISAFSGTDSINLNVATIRRISEHYKLAWTSYALVVDANDDLQLYYKFNANVGANYTTGLHNLLLQHVSTFKFRGTEGAIRFKICKSERVSDDVNLSSCKEKVVF